MFRCIIATTLLAGLALASSASAAPADPKLATEGVAILKKYCHRCHGVENKYPGLDVLDRTTLLRPKDPKEDPFLVAGKLDDSRIWEMVDLGQMPPEAQPQPSADEKATLKRWIEAGGEFPDAQRVTRDFIGEDTILGMIATDMSVRPAADLPFTRYFGLVHLWNDLEMSDDELRLIRAAVSKLCNSLSRQEKIAMPRQVDSDGLVLAIDLRSYGWTNKQWSRILEAYPYGLSRSTDDAKRVTELSQCELPYVRADWFVRHASRPPLYHDLLNLPPLAKTLETELGVNVQENFAADRLARAAFQKSGVSSHNRMVERHATQHGAYWKSYDFGKDTGPADLFRFPLGPVFPTAINRAAFKHDGGEIIFTLANGLQAYLLIKEDDTRIDEGPIAIVNDANQFSGSPAIVNGISCMGCHRDGMIRFEDKMRANYSNLSGQPTADKVLKLYPPKEDMSKLVEGDRERFLKACGDATLAYLRSGAADQRTTTDFPEPVTHSSELYGRRLTIADVGRELGLPQSPETATRLGLYHQGELATAIKVSNELRKIGLAPLATGEEIPREAWEQAYRRTARALKLGVPLEFATSQ